GGVGNALALAVACRLDPQVALDGQLVAELVGNDVDSITACLLVEHALFPIANVLADHLLDGRGQIRELRNALDHALELVALVLALFHFPEGKLQGLFEQAAVIFVVEEYAVPESIHAAVINMLDSDVCHAAPYTIVGA